MKISKQSDFCNEIKQYFYDVNKYNRLTIEEEKEIGKLVKEGDEKAINKLILCNLKFVIMIAKSYKSYGIPFSDLIAEGNIGLIKAAKKFDFTKDNKFISYAVWWIKQSIQDYIKKNVSLNTEVQEIFTVINKEESDDFVNDDLLEDDYDEEISKIETVSSLMECLNRREIDIISSYFGLGNEDELTLEEIGNKYGLTKERVRQIKEKALIKLRSSALLYKTCFDE